MTHIEVRLLREHGRELAPLEWNLVSGLRQGTENDAESELLTRLLSTLADIEAGQKAADRLTSLVRNAAEYFGVSLERAILYGTAFFDPAPEYRELRWFLSESPVLRGVSEQALAATDEAWDAALGRLLRCRLLEIDERGVVGIHWRIMELISGELRQHLSDTWRQGHLRLREYFAGIPEKHQPDTIAEMQPLFRALWHGCQAGDFLRTASTIGKDRLCRGMYGYILSELGDAQNMLTVLENFTPDHLTFPIGCDLDEELRAVIINGCGFCLRPMDRLEEAYACAREAWRRLRPDCTLHSLGPIADNLLRLQIIFGDFGHTWEVLNRLRMRMKQATPTPEIWDVPASFLAETVGQVGAMCASALWWMAEALPPEGRLASFRNSISRFIVKPFFLRTMARLVMAQTMRQCRLLARGNARTHLAPGMAMQYHALLLLDMGRWQECELAEAAGELEKMDLRGRMVHADKLIRGRWRSLKARTLAGEERKRLCREALSSLQHGLECTRRAGYRWWQAAYLLAIAQHEHDAQNPGAAGEAARDCLVISEKAGFRILQQLAATILKEK